jgi:hypothetical protein
MTFPAGIRAVAGITGIRHSNAFSMVYYRFPIVDLSRPADTHKNLGEDDMIDNDLRSGEWCQKSVINEMASE